MTKELKMDKPPRKLDGAKVLYWARSDEEPFGYLYSADGSIDASIYGFAVCVLGGTIYRFSCDQQWHVQNDSTWDTPQEAMDAYFPQYSDRAIRWNKNDDTDIEALLDDIHLVPFYREVGERFVIQKILAYLKQHNCEGMAVQSDGKEVWLLLIMKKDIALAREIIEQNVGP